MRFQSTPIPGLVLIDSPPAADARGSFARIHSRREFAEQGIRFEAEQTSVSYNRKRGTVRGLHYQLPPFVEAKLVSCVAGSAFDAVVDLRRASPAFGRAFWIELKATAANMVYVPEGCAHGYQTLVDDTTLLYAISVPYDAASARGVRWNDPAFGIPWPEPKTAILSERDRTLPLLAQLPAEF
jgi:dTDP-4-dehydrorhamnose 3,5-epimerase